jgi:hypothetical protein
MTQDDSDEKYWTLAVLTWDDLQRILRDNTLEVREQLQTTTTTTALAAHALSIARSRS